MPNRATSLPDTTIFMQLSSEIDVVSWIFATRMTLCHRQILHDLVTNKKEKERESWEEEEEEREKLALLRGQESDLRF